MNKDKQRGRGIVSMMHVTERGSTVEGPYAGTCPTSPGALYDECNVNPALTEHERVFPMAYDLQVLKCTLGSTGKER